MLGGFLSLALARILPDIGDALVTADDRIAVLSAFPAIGRWIGANPSLAAFVVGAGTFGLFLARVCGDRFNRVFLGYYDPLVLHPLARQLPDELREGGAEYIQLPFLLGDDGARRDAWNSLEGWAFDGSLRKAKKRSDAPMWQPFSVAILVGRSGGGKTRMAAEFGRHLARRDALGTDGRSRPIWKFGVYLRRVMWGWDVRRDDPWDAGLLLKSEGERWEQYLARLAVWQPRAPTLLIMDDPGRGEISQVLTTLAGGLASARHPVRLLIVNQSVPTDSPFRYDSSEDRWLYGSVRANPPPIRLGRDAWFNPRETRLAVFQSGALANVPEETRALVRDELFDISRGNPLIVELAAEYLAEGNDPEKLDANILHVRRARRILLALEDAGVSDSYLSALIVSTMIGGAEALDIEAALGTLGEQVERPSMETLRHAFPVDPLHGAERSGRLPAARPTIIGEQFVEVALRKIGPDRAERLLVAAAKCSASDLLRMLSRRLAPDSILGKLLNDKELIDLPGIDTLSLAKAWLERTAWARDAARASRKQLLSDFDKLKTLITRIRETPGYEARTAFAHHTADAMIGWVSDSKESDRDETVFSAVILAAVIWANDGDPEHSLLGIEKWEGLLTALGEYPVGELLPGELHDLPAAVGEIRDDRSRLRALLELTWEALPGFLAPAMHALQPVMEDHDDSRLAKLFRIAHAASHEEPDWTDREFSGLYRLDAREEELDYAIAFRYWAEATAEAMPEKVFKAVPSLFVIARRYAEDREVCTAVLRAALKGSFAIGELSEEKVALLGSWADQAERIARSFGGSGKITILAIMFRAREAYCWNQFPLGSHAEQSRRAAETACELAQTGGEPSAIARAVEALRFAGFAYGEMPDGRGLDDIAELRDQMMSISSGLSINGAGIDTDHIQIEEYWLRALGKSTDAEIDEVNPAIERSRALREKYPLNDKIDLRYLITLRSAAHTASIIRSASSQNVLDRCVEESTTVCDRWLVEGHDEISLFDEMRIEHSKICQSAAVYRLNNPDMSKLHEAIPHLEKSLTNLRNMNPSPESRSLQVQALSSRANAKASRPDRNFAEVMADVDLALDISGEHELNPNLDDYLAQNLFVISVLLGEFPSPATPDEFATLRERHARAIDQCRASGWGQYELLRFESSEAFFRYRNSDDAISRLIVQNYQSVRAIIDSYLDGNIPLKPDFRTHASSVTAFYFDFFVKAGELTNEQIEDTLAFQMSLAPPADLNMLQAAETVAETLRMAVANDLLGLDRQEEWTAALRQIANDFPGHANIVGGADWAAETLQDRAAASN